MMISIVSRIYVILRILLVFLLFSESFLGQELVPKEEKGKWGYTQTNGLWVIKPKFQEARPFLEDLAAVRKGKKWGFIDTEGKFVVKPKYLTVNDFSEGLAAVQSYKRLPGLNRYDHMQFKWGYVNKEGLLVIPYMYRSAQNFQKSIALVSNWGQHPKERFMINTKGDAISVPFVGRTIYNDSLYRFSNVRVDGDSVYKYATLQGDDVTDWYIRKFEFNNFPVQVYWPSFKDDSVVSAFKGDARTLFVAMMNEKGKVFTEWYNKIEAFDRGIAPVRYKHKWGFVNENYQWLVKPLYRDIELLKRGYYDGQIDAHTSELINYKGEVLSHRANSFKIFDDQFFLANYVLKTNSGEEKYQALYDSLGQQRTGWYDKIHSFQTGIARVEEWKNTLFMSDSVGLKKWYNYVVDSTGEVLCFWRPEVEISWELENRNYRDSVLQYLYGKEVNYPITEEFFQEINLKTLEYFPSKNKIIFRGGDFSEGMALVARKVGVKTVKENGVTFTMDDVRYGYIDWMGKQVIPYKYKEAGNFSGGKAIVREGDKYGAIDFKGRVIIKPQYKLMGSFGSGLAPVLKDSLWGFVNSNNKLVIDYQFKEIRPFRFGYAAVKKDKEWGVIATNGSMLYDYKYRKPPKPLSRNKIEVLKKGVGYVVETIGEDN